MPQESDDLLSLLEGQRKYASFFELDGKWRKELSVGKELVRALNSEFGYSLHGLALHEPDPPDLVCSIGSERIALEVTELVCSKAVKANEMGREVYREWRPGETAQALRSLLQRKDAIKLQGGPFSSLWVCVFTDEFTLTAERVAEELATVTFAPLQQISKAFLLFSYQPGKSTYPVVPLRLVA